MGGRDGSSGLEERWVHRVSGGGRGGLLPGPALGDLAPFEPLLP